MREIIWQVCAELGVTIVNGALSRDHVHLFVETPPHVAVSDFVRRAKGRSSRKKLLGQMFDDWAIGAILPVTGLSKFSE